MTRTQDPSNISVLIKGMVCSFCVQGIERSFQEEPSTEALSVSLETRTVTIKLKPSQTLSDDKIREIIKDAGYDLEKIIR